MAQQANVFSAVAIVIAAVFVAYGASPSANEGGATAAEAPARIEAASAPEAGNGYASVTLSRDPDSHFYAAAQVNGAVVRFMIDTGASSVVLTADDARRAGLGTGDFTATGRGAGGDIALRPANAARLALGPLGVDNVPVMIAKEGLPVSLLGQSYLSRIGTVSISGDRMTLR